MFIISAKMNKKKWAVVLVAAAAVIAAIVLLIRGSGASSSGTGNKSQQKLLRSAKVDTNQGRLELLTALGWEVNIQPEESKEVRIPKEFSPVYDQYNELQKQQGLDLTRYQGKKVMRYTYLITNHPSGETNVRATLLVSNGKLIGGDICSPRMDGFMDTLFFPKTDPSDAEPDAPDNNTTHPDNSTSNPEDPASGGESAGTDSQTPVDYQDTSIYPTD